MERKHIYSLWGSGASCVPEPAFTLQGKHRLASSFQGRWYVRLRLSPGRGLSCETWEAVAIAQRRWKSLAFLFSRLSAQSPWAVPPCYAGWFLGSGWGIIWVSAPGRTSWYTAWEPLRMLQFHSPWLSTLRCIFRECALSDLSSPGNCLSLDTVAWVYMWLLEELYLLIHMVSCSGFGVFFCTRNHDMLQHCCISAQLLRLFLPARLF